MNTVIALVCETHTYVLTLGLCCSIALIDCYHSFTNLELLMFFMVTTNFSRIIEYSKQTQILHLFETLLNSILFYTKYVDICELECVRSL